MLEEFTVSRTFYQTTLRLYVSCRRHDAEMTATHCGALAPIQKINYEDVRDPDKADQWLSDRIEGVHTTFKQRVNDAGSYA